MKKLSKLIAVVAAMIMVLAMSTSVFATSPELSADDPEVVITEIDPKDDGFLEGTDSEVEAAIEDILADSNITLPDGYDVKLLAKADVDYDGKEKTPTIAFTVSGANEGDTVYVLHYADNGKWYLYSGVADEDGVIEITFKNGFSPMYFFVVANADGKTATLVTPPGFEFGSTELKSYNTGF